MLVPEGIITESIQTDRQIAADSGAQASAIADLTDNTSGTPSGTLDAIPDPADSPANADALRDDLVANTLPPIRDNIASLNADLDSIKAALRGLGIIAT